MGASPAGEIPVVLRIINGTIVSVAVCARPNTKFCCLLIERSVIAKIIGSIATMVRKGQDTWVNTTAILSLFVAELPKAVLASSLVRIRRSQSSQNPVSEQATYHAIVVPAIATDIASCHGSPKCEIPHFQHGIHQSSCRRGNIHAMYTFLKRNK